MILKKNLVNTKLEGLKVGCLPVGKEAKDVSQLHGEVSEELSTMTDVQYCIELDLIPSSMKSNPLNIEHC